MGNGSFSTKSLLPAFCILLFSCSLPELGSGNGGHGGSADCLPPPPPPKPICPPPPPPPPKPKPKPCPQEPDFKTENLYKDYKVIQKFKNTITSDPQGITKTWNGPDICAKDKYLGFYCDDPPHSTKGKNTTVASVDFNGYKLGAMAVDVDDFITGLKRLAIFHANSNNFNGTISLSTISKLHYIYEIDLSNNKLSGPFPTAVLGLTDILFLDLRFNFFTGAVPNLLFVLGLEVIFLNNNDFAGTIPENLGTSPVSYLTFANNKFTGPIPTSIRNDSETLIEVLFLNNKLSGCLPYEIGYLKNANVFDAGYNRLTGPLPIAFGCLKEIELLNLAGNLLYGNIPEVVCALGPMGNLVNLSLSDNYFTEVGPTCMTLIKKGVLDVRKNCIPGLKSQRSTAECAAFQSEPKYCPSLTWRHYPKPICTLPRIPTVHSPPAPYHLGPWPYTPPAAPQPPSYASLGRNASRRAA